jgi:hypothetical protein
MRVCAIMASGGAGYSNMCSRGDEGETTRVKRWERRGGETEAETEAMSTCHTPAYAI